MLMNQPKLFWIGMFIVGLLVTFTFLTAQQSDPPIRPSDAQLAVRVGNGESKALQMIQPTQYEAIPAVTQLVRDPRPEVRAAAVATLGRFDRERVDPQPVAEALRADDDPDVRAAAAKTLGTLYAWDGMPELVAALRDPDLTVRRRAAKAVQRILGVDHGYRADALPADREKVVRRIEAEWPQFHGSHLAYMQRLKDEASH
ncbi:MAG: hypothetical protein GC159_01675 [Phycisphaera sp.]|nr:hypothetical protein [Phycisphaera sp.]